MSSIERISTSFALGPSLSIATPVALPPSCPSQVAFLHPLMDFDTTSLQPQDGQAINYQGQMIVLPKKLSSYSNSILRHQQEAIDKGAVYKVKKPKRVDIIGWSQKWLGVQMNIPPIIRKELHLRPICYVMSNGFVVAGAFIIATKDCYNLPEDSKISLSPLKEYDAILERLTSEDALLSRVKAIEGFLAPFARGGRKRDKQSRVNWWIVSVEKAQYHIDKQRIQRETWWPQDISQRETTTADLSREELLHVAASLFNRFSSTVIQELNTNKSWANELREFPGLCDYLETS